ncbi:MAG: sugar isomerase [Micrococcales bacterium]|nr:sugar isomerase [Micrococcales bacterium]
MTSHVTQEIASQPACWAKAIDLATQVAHQLPKPGQRVAVIGCGTSWFIAMSYAAKREAAGLGETDAFTAAELPAKRPYDAVLAISRSGTTTEVAQALTRLAPATQTTAILGVPDSPIGQIAGQVVDLSFADERSVVQTRFATTTLTLLRAHLGEDLSNLPAGANQALAQPLPAAWIKADQATFLGQGWTIGLAQEAALKMRESSQSWAEAYPAMDYRHGPISIAQPSRLVWMFGPAPDGLADQVAATGATWITSPLDPQADLVLAQRLAVARALDKGLDPDQPRHLTRSVVLDEATT